MRLAPLTLLVSVALGGGCNRLVAPMPFTGPSGGDLVPLNGGTAYAELLANAETGEVMVHTWDKDLRTRRPVQMESIRVGAGENSADLMPYPMDGDPVGQLKSLLRSRRLDARRDRPPRLADDVGRGGRETHVRLAKMLARREGARTDVGGDGRTPAYGAWPRPPRRAERAMTHWMANGPKVPSR